MLPGAFQFIKEHVPPLCSQICCGHEDWVWFVIAFDLGKFEDRRLGVGKQRLKALLLICLLVVVVVKAIPLWG